MKQLFKGLVIGLSLLPALVMAHGAPRLQVEESIIINAAPDKVWAVISDFGGLAAWHPAVESVDATGSEAGAKRTFTVTGGATVGNELKKVDAEKMTLMYTITDISKAGEIDDQGHPHEVPAVPVSKYKGWMSVSAVDGGSEVKWWGKFFRAYHGKQEVPPAELGDDAATNAISGFYKAGLESLKASLEK